MRVTETGGHKVAPMPTAKAKMVEYKTLTESCDRERGGGGGGGGGGSHLAATVKNTVRRLLRRTESHREPPSAICHAPPNQDNANNQATLNYCHRRHTRPRVRRQNPSDQPAVVDPCSQSIHVEELSRTV
ncbi:uncharacterized protein LOC143185391 [Calliopsis andreniformis]|uniref:uncharacterized protein LOC143185391 n=1 Tax=Calliopsis andreniformis TaxID=337506 RepID=UPI003FCD93A4